MINDFSLRQLINTHVNKQSGDLIHNILIGCLCYDIIYKELTHDSNKLNHVNNMVKSYYDSMEYKLNLYKNERISYNDAYLYVSNLSPSSFLSLERINIRATVKMLENTQSKAKFSSSYYDMKMYNVLYLSNKENKYLKYVHEKIMCKIVYYYMDKLRIHDNDVFIVSANEAKDNAGKVLEFSIRNVDSARIMSDIKSGNININYFSINIKNNNVLLITK